MLHRANAIPFATGAALSFLLSTTLLRVPSSGLPTSTLSSFLPGKQDVAPYNPLDAFRESWSSLPSPASTTREYATSPNRVCVMNVDTRPLEPVVRSSSPSELNFWTFAAYYNLWWTLRHGYSYSMVHTDKFTGYHPAWTKTKAIRDMVASPDCELVVFLDSDAYVAQPSYSIYDLLDRWGWHERAAMLIAMDQPISVIPHNQNATNTGFMVFRSGPKALQILDDILACPETIPDCAQWKLADKYEQTAFNLFVRPKLVEGEELVIIPCDEGNGNYKNKWCHGKFITHAWHALDSVTERVGNIIVQETFAWLSQHFDEQLHRRSTEASAQVQMNLRRHVREFPSH